MKRFLLFCFVFLLFGAAPGISQNIASSQRMRVEFAQNHTIGHNILDQTFESTLSHANVFYFTDGRVQVDIYFLEWGNNRDIISIFLSNPRSTSSIEVDYDAYIVYRPSEQTRRNLTTTLVLVTDGKLFVLVKQGNNSVYTFRLAP